VLAVDVLEGRVAGYEQHEDSVDAEKNSVEDKVTPASA
jgi:hypothetical protein